MAVFFDGFIFQIRHLRDEIRVLPQQISCGAGRSPTFKDHRDIRERASKSWQGDITLNPKHNQRFLLCVLKIAIVKLAKTRATFGV